MARAELVADTEDHPDARLFVRGFGVHQILAAGITLAALDDDDRLRDALLLSLLVDVSDIAAAAAEAQARGAVDRGLISGFAISGAGAAIFAAALRALDR